MNTFATGPRSFKKAAILIVQFIIGSLCLVQINLALGGEKEGAQPANLLDPVQVSDVEIIVEGLERAGKINGSESRCENAAVRTIQDAFLNKRLKKTLREHQLLKSDFSFNKADPKTTEFFDDLKKTISKAAMDSGLTTRPILFLKITRPYVLPRGTLTTEEERSLRSYTSGGYTDMNQLLRQPDALKQRFEEEYEKWHKSYGIADASTRLKEVLEKNTSVQSALKKFPVFPGEFVYRYGHSSPERVGEFTEGKIYHEQGFLSVSKRIEFPGSELAMPLPTGQELLIFAIKHKSARDVSMFSRKVYEEEALIPSGRSFRIHKVISEGENRKVVLMEELEPTSHENVN